MSIEHIDAVDFDWDADEGPAAEVRRIARAATAHDGSITLNEQAVLQLKNRGLRDASLWLGDGGFALRHGDIVDLAVHPESRRNGVGTALAAEVAADGRKVEAWSHGDHPGAGRIAEKFGVARERELKIMRRSLAEPVEPTVPDGVRDQGLPAGGRVDAAGGQRQRLRPPPRAGSHDPRGLPRAHE